ncbi:MAG: SIMPL domain-containing protein [Thermomicrobiales bacterium]
MDEREFRGISVDGRGAMTAAPDTARISVGVDVVMADLAEARAEAARQANAVIEAVKARGIAKKDIQTTNLSVSVQRDFDRNGDPTKIKGYGVRNEVLVIVRDLEQIGGVLDDVVAAGGNNVSGPEFFIDRPEALEDEARRLAVADARRKAGILADAAGAALGEVLAISETTDFLPAPRGMAMLRKAAAPMADTPVEAGTQEIVVNVRVRWGLAGAQDASAR